jgi:hypothetical protein
VNTFSQWIQNETKEKWSLLFDKGGVRHGIMITNFAEAYNAVLRGARAQPLVGIIEFFLYRTMKYFLERANAAHATMQDPQKVYSTWMTEYLTKNRRLLCVTELTQNLYVVSLAMKCSGNIEGPIRRTREGGVNGSR